MVDKMEPSMSIQMFFQSINNINPIKHQRYQILQRFHGVDPEHRLKWNSKWFWLKLKFSNLQFEGMTCVLEWGVWIVKDQMIIVSVAGSKNEWLDCINVKVLYYHWSSSSKKVLTIWSCQPSQHHFLKNHFL